MKRSYKNDLCGAIHETCQILHEHGAISDTEMAEFDGTCLVDNCMPPEKIRRLREDSHLSHSVLARHLGVSRDTLISWETGEQCPAGPAMRLLLLLEKKGFDAIRL